MASARSTTLAGLPEELLEHIYAFLVTSSPSDAKSFRLVSKQFHRVDSLARRRLRFLRVEFLQTLLSAYPNLRELDLSLCPCIQDGTVSLLLAPGSHHLFRRVSSGSAVSSVASAAPDDFGCHRCSGLFLGIMK